MTDIFGFILFTRHDCRHLLLPLTELPNQDTNKYCVDNYDRDNVLSVYIKGGREGDRDGESAN
jgi:hypothetical protein